jgi:hypothetical protein
MEDEAAGSYRRYIVMAAACDHLSDAADLAALDCLSEQSARRAERLLREDASIETGHPVHLAATPGGKTMDTIFQRLKEPSTYAGIAAFLAGFGLLGLTEQDWNQIFGAVAALAAVAAIFLKEQSGTPNKQP